MSDEYYQLGKDFDHETYRLMKETNHPRTLVYLEQNMTTPMERASNILKQIDDACEPKPKPQVVEVNNLERQANKPQANVALLSLKDNLTIAEAGDYLVGILGVESASSFSYIAGLVNEQKINIYINSTLLGIHYTCSNLSIEDIIDNNVSFGRDELKFKVVYLRGKESLAGISGTVEVEIANRKKANAFYSVSLSGNEDVLHIRDNDRGDVVIQGEVLIYQDFGNGFVLPPPLKKGMLTKATEIAIYGNGFFYIKRKEIDTLVAATQPEQAPQEDFIKPELGKHGKQEIIILEKIQELGYHPKQLPPYEVGKKGVRSELREVLKEHDLFQSKTGFSKAWERLLNDSAIKYL